MRNLLKVIDQIIEVAPDLKDNFRSLKDSICYTAPELISDRWAQAADILNTNAWSHPKGKEIAAIFSGQKEAKP